MVARVISYSSNSSEQNSFDESVFYNVNLYYSDVALEPPADTGPCPYHYEPHRVQRDDGQ